VDTPWTLEFDGIWWPIGEFHVDPIKTLCQLDNQWEIKVSVYNEFEVEIEYLKERMVHMAWRNAFLRKNQLPKADMSFVIGGIFSALTK
jgi:hypothetical protein